MNAVLASLKAGRYSLYDWNTRRKKLYDALWTRNTKKISDVFTGAEYKALVILLGEEWAEKFKKIWDRMPDYIYSTGMERRSFRTRGCEELYLYSGISKLEEMINLVANDFSYEKYFSQRDNTYAYSGVIPDLLALETDEGNREVTVRIGEIIYGDNNTGLMTREIIKGTYILLLPEIGRAHV